MTYEITEVQSTVVVSAIAVVALIAEEREAREAPAFGGVKVCSWNKFLQGFKGSPGGAMNKAACILLDKYY